MIALLKLLETNLSFLLNPGRFRIGGSTAGGEQHASITLESDDLRLELVRERDEIFARIMSTATPEMDWFWIGVYRRVIWGEHPGSDVLDDSAIDFLRQELDGISRRFSSEDHRADFLALLIAERAQRSHELFG